MAAVFVAACLCRGAAGQDAATPPAPGELDQVRLTFPDNVKLKTVIDYVATRLGRNIIYDESLAARSVTLRSPVPVSRAELLALLRSALRACGLALVDAEQQGWLKVVPDERISKTLPLHLLRPPEAPDANTVVTCLIKLRYFPPKRFIDLIKPLLTSPGGHVLELPDGETLIVTDYKVVVDAVLQLRQKADLAKLKRGWKIVTLENASAPQVAATLWQLIDKTIPAWRGKGATPVKEFIADVAGINAFLLTGTAEQIRHMESMIRLVDVPSVITTRIHPLENTSARRGAMVLGQLALPLQRNLRPGEQWIITVDSEANALIVTCPEPHQAQIAKWIAETIDLAAVAAPTGTTTRVFQVKYARASELAATIRSVFSVTDGQKPIQLDLGRQPGPAGRPPPARRPTTRPAGVRLQDAAGAQGSPVFTLTVHQPTNSIIATGTIQMLSQVRSLIEHLDHHRPQVLIDVTIVSVSESHSFDMGVEIHHLHANSEGKLERGILTSFGLLDVDPVTGAGKARFGTGINAVLLRPDEFHVILRAFRSRLNGQVIARPQLLVDDNATGVLNSVTEQPYTSVNSGQTVATTSFAGYQEAGTQLTLTPHITEGGVVHLTYRILSSSFLGAAVSENTPPPRATDSVHSQVTIPSGYVLLVGGLTREDRQEARSEVPFLADIPILGELFRLRSSNRSRSVLYVFLRPRILREDRFAYLKFISRNALKAAGVAPETPAMEMEFLR